MSSEWKEFRLGDITDWTSGGTPSKKNADFWNGTIPWISASSMSDNRYNESDLKITQEGLKAGSRLAKKNSILLLVRGSTLHQRIPVGIATLDVSFNQDVKAIKAKEEFIDPWYLLFWFMAKEKDLLNMVENTGIGAGKLDTSRLQDLLIRIPPDSERDKILLFAKALDDKLFLNRQINQTLEQMAQAMFKSWFVDFEPVKAKIAAIEAGEDAEGVTRAAMSAISGKTDEELDQLQAEQPEHYTQLKTTAELFPSAIQDSEFGDIPRGWMVRTLGSLSTELRRGISPKYTDEDGILVINQKCIRNHSVNFSLARRNDTRLRKVKGREIQVGDILVNSTGVGTLGRLAPIRYLPEPAVVDSHVTVVRASDEVGPLFLNEYMLTKESFIEASGAGSTGQTELRKQVLEELFVVVPNRILIDLFEIILKPISSCIAEKENECQSLSQLRDTLLPKLLSGELEVNAINEAEG